jgi:hypothetical protein
MIHTGNGKPSFLITIDTEGDDLWSIPTEVTTENARYLPRFQSLCERYKLKPTWLTNYEMAECPFFSELGHDVLQRGTGEIGMHLHAWDSPPLTDGPRGQAYLIEYPQSAMRNKIGFMTSLLEDRFGRKMVSHRSGRWAFNSCYARLLVEHGYLVDCSVTPRVSWANVPGDPNGSGGTDYSLYPSHPYFMDLDRIDREGDSPLLEVPVSIVSESGRLQWLRPDGRNLDSMCAILRRARAERWPCVEFAFHSSELMAGGSPTFQTEDSIERLYDDLEALFTAAADGFRADTLSEFYDGMLLQTGRRHPGRQPVHMQKTSLDFSQGTESS